MMYTVGEMASLLNIPASTLRYYDKEGLLPFVERSSGGMRMFKENDYEWLQVINCLKKTGMPLKDIRAYIEMAMRGDSTISGRLELIVSQREAVMAQIAELQQNLHILDFKKWYYETAQAAGTTDILKDMPIEQLPREYQAVKQNLQKLPENN